MAEHTWYFVTVIGLVRLTVSEAQDSSSTEQQNSTGADQRFSTNTFSFGTPSFIPSGLNVRPVSIDNSDVKPQLPTVTGNTLADKKSAKSIFRIVQAQAPSPRISQSHPPPHPVSPTKVVRKSASLVHKNDVETYGKSISSELQSEVSLLPTNQGNPNGEREHDLKTELTHSYKRYSFPVSQPLNAKYQKEQSEVSFKSTPARSRRQIKSWNEIYSGREERMRCMRKFV